MKLSKRNLKNRITLIVWCLLSSEKITIIWKVFSFSILHHFSFSKKNHFQRTKSSILNFKFSKLDSMQETFLSFSSVCNNDSPIKFSFFFFYESPGAYEI